MIGSGGHAAQLRSEGCQPWLDIIAIGDNRARKKEAEANKDAKWGTFKHGAEVAWSAKIGAGCQLLVGSIVGCNARIGQHCIINHRATVNHDAQLGDFVHVAPGAQVLGGATVGEGCLIGANAVVLPSANVPAWVIVRACSVWPCDYEPNGPRKVKCAS